MRMNWKDRAAYNQQAREMAKSTPATMCVCGHDSDDHAAFEECDRCECRTFKAELTPAERLALAGRIAEALKESVIGGI